MLITDLAVDQKLLIRRANARFCTHEIGFSRDTAIQSLGGAPPMARLRLKSRCSVCNFLGATTTVLFDGQTGFELKARGGSAIS